MRKPYYPWWLDKLADDVTGRARLWKAPRGARRLRLDQLVDVVRLNREVHDPKPRVHRLAESATQLAKQDLLAHARQKADPTQRNMSGVTAMMKRPRRVRNAGTLGPPATPSGSDERQRELLFDMRSSHCRLRSCKSSYPSWQSTMRHFRLDF
jgi:hypothetical protein